MLGNYLSEEKEDKEWMKKVSSNYKATKYHEKDCREWETCHNLVTNT